MRRTGRVWMLTIGAASAIGFAETSCAFLRDQFTISSTSGCITKNCKDPDATAYRECESACRRTYGR